MDKRHTVLIVDDHPLFREGVRSLIGRSDGFAVAGEAGDLETAARLARELRPRLLLLDLSLPDGSGVKLIRELSIEQPETSIIALSMHSAIEMVAESFQAGAMGYLVKESTGERLAQALQTVADGGQYLDGSISPAVIRKLMDYSARKARQEDSSYADLTRREQQVLRLLAEGLSPASAAARLFISRKTVENHRGNIMTKLGLKTPLELVRYAMRKGLIDMDNPFATS